MKKLILAMLVCAGFCACSNEDVVTVGTTADDTDAVYVKFGLSLADITRATTDTPNGSDYVVSSDGEEYGQTYENAVKSLSVVLTDESGNTIVATTVSNPTLVGTDTYVVTFQRDDIKSYANTTVGVYIYCNQSVATYEPNATYSYPTITPWTENAFYMTNAVEHTALLPEDMSAHNTAANPIDLGVVRVERSVARFDYKDGCKDPTGAPYTYPMAYDEYQALQASLVIEEVALINMSNDFYAFRHMADTVDPTASNLTADLENVTLLSTEYADNWVVDTDASGKLDYVSTGASLSFTYPLDYPSKWEWTKLSELDTEDDNSTWNDSETKGDYYIWRYAIENTIPSVEDQKKGITTGIVFKARLKNETEANSGYVFGGENGGRVYVYEQVLYPNWDAVVTAALAAGEGSTLHDAYLQVLDAVEAGGQFDEYDDDVTAAMAEAGFTGYSPDEDGNYYVYYYYWNRHNDNSLEDMGVMEFAVVRNNVYKLSVTDITGWGHPTPSSSVEPGGDPDPDPEYPDEPDESEDIYLKVDVEILPWVVRVNDITF